MLVSSCSNPTLGSTKRLGTNSRDLEVPRLSDRSTKEKQTVCPSDPDVLLNALLLLESQ